MKFLRMLVTFIAVLVIIAGCAQTPASPTISPAEVEMTAISVASTIIAQTRAAIPTDTSLPPTETPTATLAVTDTPVASPTPAVSPTPIPPTTDPNVDPCSTRVLSGVQGKPTTIRIVNTTKNPISVSIYLNETASHGACGYRTYNLSKNNDVVITDLVQGCYNLWAWSTDNKSPWNSAGYGCINNEDKWTFEVSTAAIKFVGP